MKRILALILSVSLLVGLIMTAPVSAEEIQLTETDEALNLLTYMGIAKKSDNLVSNITRADFAVAVATAVKAQSSNGKQYYIDVEATSSAFESISALTELGYFSGGGNMSFRPGDNIRLAEAAKIVTSMAGYSVLCEAKGGYPAGYLEVASRLGITRGITGEYITREQAYIILMRALNTPLYIPEGISAKGTKYESDENTTILSQYHDIYYIENTVNAVGQISLEASSLLSEGQVLIGNKILRTDEISQDMYDYLGMTIVGYYTETEAKDASLIVALPMGDDNNVTVVNKDELSTIEDNGGYYIFTYYDEDDKQKTIKIPRGCIVIKNGMSVTSDLFNELSISKGSYKFLDHDGDKKTDVLIINEYYNLIAGLIDNKEGMVYLETEYDIQYHRGPIGSGGTIYDKYDRYGEDGRLLKVDLTEDNDKIVKIKDAYGNLITINNIVPSDVLSVYKSNDEKYIEVIKGIGNVMGTISEIVTLDNNTNQLTIGDQTYKISTDVIDKINDKEGITPGLGFTGTFWLDAFGEIAYFEESVNSNIIFGYLLEIDRGTKAFDTSVYLKIYGANNVLDIYTWDEKTVVDGGRIKDVETAYGTLTAHTKQVIRFAADENKVLTFLDTHGTEINEVNEENKNSLRQTQAYGTNSLNEITLQLNSGAVTASSTPMITVPDDTIIDQGVYDENFFRVSTRGSNATSFPKEIALYSIDGDGLRESLILRKVKYGVGDVFGFAPFMIDEVKNGMDEEGGEVSIVKGYNNKRPAQYQTVDEKVLDGYNIKKGDLVWFELDKNNRIVSVLDVFVDNGATLNYTVYNKKISAYPPIKYDHGAGELAGSVPENIELEDVLENLYYSNIIANQQPVASDDTGKYTVMYGYAGLVKDGIIKFAYTKEDCENEKYKFVRSISSAPVIVFDKNYGRDGGIYWTNWEDIVDYKNDPEACSNVVLYVVRNVVQRIYMYK